jgi:glucosylceramidase
MTSKIFKNTIILLILSGLSVVNAQQTDLWITKLDKSILFEKQNQRLRFDYLKDDLPTIFVDDTKRFQTMDGFGFTLTGGSATLINQLDRRTRDNLLKELFTTDRNNIGVSYLRISIGASDLSDHAYTYNDMPEGKTDNRLRRFSLEKEEKDLIPILKSIIRINPEIKILGSPWSPPAWMKTNENLKGGSLKPQFYDEYARYLVKYIEEMKREGIKIDAITIQNEPLHLGNNPSLLMQASEQATFIKKYLGPEFRKANLSTKIIIYDHNADRPDYPISILNDTDARQYIDGSAFHLYGGNVEAIRDVYEAHPDKNLYFTEQWIGHPSNFGGDMGWHMKNLIIGASKNYCKTVLEWNLAADANQNPHTEGGCTACLGALTIDNQEISRNTAYFIIAHASKFVRPNSVRIASNITMSLPNVAFRTPDNRTVLIVMNEDEKEIEFNIGFKEKKPRQKLEGKTVATYIW